MGSWLLRILPPLAGLVLLGVLWDRLGGANILQLLRHAMWGFLGMVLLFTVQEMFRALGVLRSLPLASRPSFKDMLHIRFVGEGIRAVTLTGPFLAEPARAWFIRKQGIRAHDAAAATIADFVVHGLVSAFATTLAAWYFIELVGTPGPVRIASRILLYGSSGYLVLAAFVLYRRIRVIGPGIRLLARLPGLRRALSGSIAGVYRTEEALHAILLDSPGTLTALVSVQIMSHLLLFLEAYCGILSMGVDISILAASASEVLTKLANISVFGASEGAYAVVFSAFGLPAAAGFTLSILKRARSLAVALAGMGSLAVLSIRQPR